MRTDSPLLGVAVLAAAVALFVPGSLAAGNFQFQFGNVFSGRAPMPADGPWIDAVFQTVSPGTVRLTIDNADFAAGENVEGLYFNLYQKVNPANLKFTVVGESGGFKLPQITTGANQFKVPGQGAFDIKMDFSAGGDAVDLFGAGESLVLQVSGIPNLTASDFACVSTVAARGCGSSYAAAQVGRSGCAASWIDPTGASAVMPVPEPTPSLLALLGAEFGLVFCGGRRKLQTPSS
jgi:hypothetical protein